MGQTYCLPVKLLNSSWPLEVECVSLAQEVIQFFTGENNMSFRRTVGPQAHLIELGFILHMALAIDV